MRRVYNCIIMIVTNLGAFSKSESQAEASQSAVRVDDHIRGRIIRVSVLQRHLM